MQAHQYFKWTTNTPGWHNITGWLIAFLMTVITVWHLQDIFSKIPVRNKMLSDQAMLLPPQYTTLSITLRSHSQSAESAISVVGWKTGRLPPEFWPACRETGKGPLASSTSQVRSRFLGYLGVPQELRYNLVTGLDKTMYEVRIEKTVWYKRIWISLTHAWWVAMLHRKFGCILDNAQVYAHA